jgi:hypothetical protein
MPIMANAARLRSEARRSIAVIIDDTPGGAPEPLVV